MASLSDERYEDDASIEALSNMDGDILRPDMSRDFDDATVDHIEREILPNALTSGDKRQAELCEKVLAKYGRAIPNHISGLWGALDIPRNELQVRELFAAKLPEYGYSLVCSQADFPDWLLVDSEGAFIYAEVEHRSSSFFAHGHNPELCDLVVCWEHDWVECPLPVLELFSGQVVPSKLKPPRKRHRGRLSINFAGRLSRYTPSDNFAARGKRSDDLVARYEELVSDGHHWRGIVATLAKERGITKSSISSALKNRGIRVNRFNRREVISARVSEIVASGLPKRDAIDMAAQEFGIKRASVESSLSRYKNRS